MKFFRIIVCFYILIITNISSTPYEKWNPSSSKVGEVIEYSMEYSSNEIKDFRLPDIGFYSENTNLPIADILQIENTKGSLILKIQYLKAGKYFPPVEWLDINGVWQKSNLTIEISSNLTGNEVDVLDIFGPIEFDGPFQYSELIKIFLVFLFLTGLSFYILEFIRKRRKPKDADVSYPYQAESLEPPDFKLNALMRLKEIPHKEFAYLLSDYIKVSLGKKLGIEMKYMTTEEISDILKEKYNLDQLIILRLNDYLNAIKYMPNEDVIDLKKAIEIRRNWEIALRL